MPSVFLPSVVPSQSVVAVAAYSRDVSGTDGGLRQASASVDSPGEVVESDEPHQNCPA